MNGLNEATLIGNLGKDPEVRILNGGKKVATFSVATPDNYKKGDEWVNQTDWHNIVAWGNNAELAEKHLKKGNAVIVMGRIKTRKYTGKDGIEKYVTEIVADRLMALHKNSEPQQPGEVITEPSGADKSLPF